MDKAKGRIDIHNIINAILLETISSRRSLRGALLPHRGQGDYDLELVLEHQHGEGSDLLTARYFYGDSDQSFPLALGGGTTVPGFNTVTPTRVQVL